MTRDNNGTAETRTHSNMHALNTRTIGQAPAKTLAYDANGSQTYDGEKFGFEYDANDQLKVVFVDDGTNGGTAGDGLRNGGEPIVSAYRYDVMGRRVEKAVSAGYPEGASASTTRFYYSGQRIIEERNGEQGENEKVLAFYTYGSYIDEPLTMWRDADGDGNFSETPHQGEHSHVAERFFFHHNRMFSTYALTDSTGAVAERYSYEAYGKVTTYAADYSAPQTMSRVGNPYTFTGRELDPEAGLMHYRARTYDPAQGRFKQTDPAGLAACLNLYEYVRCRPTSATDPTGRVTEDEYWDAKVAWIKSWMKPGEVFHQETIDYIGQYRKFASWSAAQWSEIERARAADPSWSDPTLIGYQQYNYGQEQYYRRKLLERNSAYIDNVDFPSESTSCDPNLGKCYARCLAMYALGKGCTLKYKGSGTPGLSYLHDCLHACKADPNTHPTGNPPSPPGLEISDCRASMPAGHPEGGIPKAVEHVLKWASEVGSAYLSSTDAVLAMGPELLKIAAAAELRRLALKTGCPDLCDPQQLYLSVFLKEANK